ncbi:hypothetical protein [Paenibacillus oryzisoli]|uniref:Uncharacterized protein n=1 Tax=Paenibacillus oryzisoli TaxID=1850517 RepID=A0A197ZXJ7_9BACL|nr:hypothetical protein [Paenibacillus oryzisoli]OAS13458.1 hypothetical protein A8708_06230 [Paenibacillus oryzisoli]
MGEESLCRSYAAADEWETSIDVNDFIGKNITVYTGDQALNDRIKRFAEHLSERDKAAWIRHELAVTTAEARCG